MIAGLLPQGRERFDSETASGGRRKRLPAEATSILIVVDLDVVDLDAVQDAVLAFTAVLHSDRRTNLNVSADLFFRESSSTARHIGYIFAVAVGDRTGALLHDEGRARCILTNSA